MTLCPDAIRYLVLIEKERSLRKKRASVQEMLSEFEDARDRATCKMAEFAAESMVKGLFRSLVQIDAEIDKVSQQTTRGTA